MSPWHCDGQLPHNRIYSFHVIISFDSNCSFGPIQLLLGRVYESCRPPSSTLLHAVSIRSSVFFLLCLSIFRSNCRKTTTKNNKTKKQKTQETHTHTHTHKQTSNWLLRRYIQLWKTLNRVKGDREKKVLPYRYFSFFLFLQRTFASVCLHARSKADLSRDLGNYLDPCV